MDEERCVDSCASKLIRSNHRLMGTYVQLMPKMVQRRMDELESKAAELANAEVQAANAGMEQAAVPVVPTVPAPAATDVPLGIISPDMAGPVTTLDAPQLPVFVPEATGAVPDLSSTATPAADMPVMNGPSLTNGAGNGAPLFVPPPTLPEVSSAVGIVPGITESPGISSEAKVVMPRIVEGPSTLMSVPSVTEIPTQGSFLSTSGEKMITSPLELPSTTPLTLPVTAPSIESSILVPDLTKAASDTAAPVLAPVLKPTDLTNGVPITSTGTSSSTTGGSQSSS